MRGRTTKYTHSPPVGYPAKFVHSWSNGTSPKMVFCSPAFQDIYTQGRGIGTDTDRLVPTTQAIVPTTLMYLTPPEWVRVEHL